MEDIRRTLQELMGSVSQDKGKVKDFTDPMVCKHYLCGLCPHDLFQNTKLYMGECKYIHSDEYREEYQKARLRKVYGYEEASIRQLRPLVDDCDRKIAKQLQERCESQEQMVQQISEGAQRQLEAVDRKIKDKMAQVEELGNKGDVDGSLNVMQEVKVLEAEKQKLVDERLTKVQDAKGVWFQKLKPCETCGALLSEKDDESRLNEHFTGRIHVGFKMIRKHILDLQEYLDNSAAVLEKAQLPRIPVIPPRPIPAPRSLGIERDRDSDRDREEYYRRRDRSRSRSPRSRSRSRRRRRHEESRHRRSSRRSRSSDSDDKRRRRRSSGGHRRDKDRDERRRRRSESNSRDRESKHNHSSKENGKETAEVKA